MGFRVGVNMLKQHPLKLPIFWAWIRVKKMSHTKVQLGSQSHNLGYWVGSLNPIWVKRVNSLPCRTCILST